MNTKGATERGEGVALPPGRKILISWFEPLFQKIKEIQKEIKSG